MVQKSCDIGGSAKPLSLHTQWAMRVASEFFTQGDLEKELGLPCSPFCDRERTKLSEAQRGFIDFIVMPVYSALTEYLASRRLTLEVMPNIEKNRGFWETFVDSNF